MQRDYKVFYRETRQLAKNLTDARELRTLRKVRAQDTGAEPLLIGDLFLRRLPAHAGDELADVLMTRDEKASTLITSTTGRGCWATW